MRQVRTTAWQSLADLRPLCPYRRENPTNSRAQKDFLRKYSAAQEQRHPRHPHRFRPEASGTSQIGKLAA